MKMAIHLRGGWEPVQSLSEWTIAVTSKEDGSVEKFCPQEHARRRKAKKRILH